MKTAAEVREEHRVRIRQAIETGDLAAIKAATLAARGELSTLQDVLAGRDRDAFGEVLSRAYAGGASERGLAFQSGWSAGEVRRLLLRAGTPKRTQGRVPALTEADVVELYERWLRGETLRELAAEAGCVASTLHRQFAPIRDKRFRAAQQAKADAPPARLSASPVADGRGFHRPVTNG